ncbi:MAG: alkaline phosphatase family protein, partial [Burkholderia gladioli]
MFENRSLDTMLGWLYPDGELPLTVLPPGSSPYFDGLRPDMANPSGSGAAVLVTPAVANSRVPDPDPQETFVNVTEQIFGPPLAPMHGFVLNYETTDTSDASQVMQCHGTAQLPVLSQLARAYAVSDAWFAPVPNQTWPNRAFAHAGTSNGHVDNSQSVPGDELSKLPDPFKWDVRTIYNVLDELGLPWAVYHDTTLVSSLTRASLPKLWDESLSSHFHHFYMDASRLPREIVCAGG